MKRFSFVALILSYIIILCFVCYYPKFSKQTTEATISYDVAGYYFYLPAIFIYHDIHHLEFQDGLMEKYKYSDAPYQGVLLPDRTYTMKYSIGAAIMYAPFFFIAHIYCSIAGFNADGFSLPYQFMLSFGCLLYVFIGLWFLRKILIRYFSETASGITLILIVAATNYLNYAAIDNAMPHNLLFTVYVFIIWFTIKFNEKPDFRHAFLLGLLCGLAIVIRPTEIICLLIPLLWGIDSIKERFKFLLHHYLKILLFISEVTLLGSIQLIYWKITTGNFIFYSYEEQTFSWFHPNIMEGLFSYKKGWLIYTPFMLLIVPGFVYLYKKNKSIFWPIAIFIILNIYISFSWDIWWYGGSLGQRSMVQSYVLLSFPLAAFFQKMLSSNKVIQAITILFCLFTVWYNFILTMQAHNKYGILDDNAMNRVYFWKIFGKLKIAPEDKKYLDLFEMHKGEKNNIQEIYFNNIENDLVRIDSNFVLSGKKCLYVNATEQATQPYALPLPPPGSTWLTISADFYFPEKEWNIWIMPQFIIVFTKDANIVKSKMIRVHRIMEQGEKKNLSFDVEIPESDYNHIEFYLWNADGITTTYMDNIRVQAFE